MLVVVYAVVGTVNIDLTCQAVGCDASGNAVYLKDLWPTPEEIQKCMERAVCSRFYQERYQKIFKGDAQWDLLNAGESDRYSWDEDSTYVKKAPYFDLQKKRTKNYQTLYMLALWLFWGIVSRPIIFLRRGLFSRIVLPVFICRKKAFCLRTLIHMVRGAAIMK